MEGKSKERTTVRRTETEHDVEKHNEQHRQRVDRKASSAHPERPPGHILPAGEQMRRDRQGIARGGQDDEAADEIRKRSLASELDGAKRRTQHGAQQHGGDGAAQAFIDGAEEGGERGGVVAGQGPEDAADGEVGAEHADHDAEEEDQEEAEGGALGAGGLRVDYGEREGAVA